MNSIIWRLILIGVFGIGAFSSSATTVYLKNGRTMEGLIKGQNDKAIQLDIGGGVVTINRSKIDRIDEGGGAAEELSDKMLRKVILTRKQAPKELLFLAFDYNDIREELNEVLGYNDEVKAIISARPILSARVGAAQKKALNVDRSLRSGKSSLGITRYNELVVQQNAINGQARIDRERLKRGNERLLVLRGKISEYRNRLLTFRSEVEERQTGVETPSTKERLFFDELLTRIGKLQKKTSGRHVVVEKLGPHTLVQVKLNGRITVPMLIDTGASTVTITREIAKQLGVVVDERNGVDMNIANGETVKGYYVVLDSVSVQGLMAEQVIATVLDKAPSQEFQGLLGMTYIENFELSLSPQTGIFELRETHF